MQLQKRVRQAPPKIEIGDKVFCTHAASSWFTVNKIYEVVAHPVTGTPSIQASDGLHDMLSLCSSKFQRMEPEQTTIEIAEPKYQEA